MTIRIPDGNAFRIRITARNIITGEYTEAADLSTINNLVINYVRRGIRFPHTYTIDEEGRATVEDAGNLDCGFYGIELTGYYGGEKFRFYGKDIFEITDDTTDIIDPTNLIDIEITVKLNASGVSKDYVDYAVNHVEATMEASMVAMEAELRDEIAAAGTVDDVKVNGVSVVSNKKANVTVPVKVSDLNNDSGYQTAQQVQQRVDAAKITDVDISIDGGVGTPSGSAAVSNNKLVIALHDIKGEKGEQGDSITGPTGPQGATSVYDSSTQNFLTTLETTTGKDQTKTMTQKAITDAIKESTLAPRYEQITLPDTRLKRYINIDTQEWVTVGTVTSSSCWLIEIPEDWVELKIIPRYHVGNGLIQYQLEFMTSNSTSGACQFAEGGMRGYVSGETSGDGTVRIPSDATHLYIRYNSSGNVVLPSFVGHNVSVEKAIKAVDGDIQTERERIDAIENKEKKHLFLGTLVQKALTETTLSESTQRISTLSVMALPYMGVTLKFKLPDGYFVGIRSGAVPNSLSNNNFWYGNGDTFTFAATARFFRLCFCKKTGTSTVTYYTIEEEEITSRLADGSIEITYEDRDNDTIIRHNYDNEMFIKAAMRNLVSGINNNGDITKRNLPTFAHTSDVHGDATRFERFVQYCDYLGVDAAMVSGDLVGREPNNRMQFINDVADLHSTPVMICMGNHDARSMSEQAQYEQVMEHLITKNSSSVDALKEYPTYYYQDFTARKIRLISLNLYEDAHSGDEVNFTQDQCEWFIETLAGTPQDYGVLVMFHSPETMPVMDQQKSAFYQQLKNYTGVQTNISGTPFAKIIDAFIAKDTTQVTYSIGNTSITVSADFSQVETGVEFIAYVCGHLHTDTIGYMANTDHMQLCLNVACCSAVYGSAAYPNYANFSDLPREQQGATQDSFNIYAIDRANKAVKVARVGSCITQDLTERKFMIIPYAQDNED